jgi:hypothetical protein
MSDQRVFVIALAAAALVVWASNNVTQVRRILG